MTTHAYLKLIRRFPLRPLRSDAELQRAIAMIDSLLKQSSMSKDEDDYLDVLSDLVHKYENEVHPLEAVPDAAMLKHLMEARDLSRAELHRQTGIALSTIGRVLSGRGCLDRRQVATLSKLFNVSADAFALPALKPRNRAANGSPKATVPGKPIGSNAKKRG